MNYYNEFDKGAAAWLRELIKAGLIPAGDVDERDIREVKGHELKKYTQRHFFAGIGGWAEALRLAGWPSDRPVDTASCPCQPFSAAGANKGEADSRDLWPDCFRVIRELGSAVVFGEQVENAIKKHGWLDRICTDLEGAGYATGAAVLPAACVGAPHIRHRLFWVAHAEHKQRQGCVSGRSEESGAHRSGAAIQSSGRSKAHGLAESASAGSLPGAHRGIHSGKEGAGPRHGKPERRGADRWMGEPIQPRLEGHAGHGDQRNQPGRQRAHAAGSTTATGATGGMDDAAIHRRGQSEGSTIEGRETGCDQQWGPQSGDDRKLPCGPEGSGAVCGLSDAAGAELQGFASAWNECGDGENHFILCRDNKIRRIPSEPAFFPLADGFQGSRVGLLRGAGNAIVPQVASEFIGAFMDIGVPQ